MKILSNRFWMTCWTFGLWMALCSFMSGSQRVAARDCFVDSEWGNNQTGDGSASNPWASITFALRQNQTPLQAGDTILVASGIYTLRPDEPERDEIFPIDLSAGISLIGEASSCVILNAATAAVPVVQVGTSPVAVTIRGITAKHTGYTHDGIVTSSTNTVRIEANQLSYNRRGISSVSGTSEIVGNIIAFNQNVNIYPNLYHGSGISIGDQKQFLIVKNTVTNNLTQGGLQFAGGGGIFIDKNSTGSIIDNTIVENEAKNDFVSNRYSYTVSLGGGIYCGANNGEYILIARNIIKSNTCSALNLSKGGGIYCERFSNVKVESNCIVENYIRAGNSWDSGVAVYGCGVCCEESSIVDIVSNDIVGNLGSGVTLSLSYTRGGGIYNSGSVSITNNNITDNRIFADFYYSNANGGGIYNSGVATVQGNVISRNSARSGGSSSTFGIGGGMYTVGSAKIANCIFFDNVVSLRNFYPNAPPKFLGGALYCEGNAEVLHCTFHNNKAEKGTICIASPGTTIANCIISGATDAKGIGGYGIYEGNPNCEPRLLHNLFWDNANGVYLNEASQAIETAAELNDAFPKAVGNCNADPLFVAPANGDFHLMRESPAIGAGIDWLDSLILPSDDLDGNPRPGASGYDLGAYQYISDPAGIEDWILK